MQILLPIALILLIFGGSISGIIALFLLRKLNQRMFDVETLLQTVRTEKPFTTAIPAFPKTETTSPPKTATEKIQPTIESTPPLREEKPQPPPSPMRPLPLSSTPRSESASLEMILGSKWLNWIGIVLLIFAMAFFLKYAYDNNWIGPLGRLCIGALTGVVALIIGEMARKKEYNILFHALSGGGIAIFYVCTYFSFQVYQLTPPSVAFFLSILVTMLSVAMGVIHNARLLCLFGQIGGFLSPILLSSGENRPIALFSYLLILNFTAMGCAFFKQWREINTTAFFGTVVLYASWLMSQHYDESQFMIAFTFSTLFYFMFLILPLLRSLVERAPSSGESLKLIVLTIFAAFVNYYHLLFEQHRTMLGFVVVAQAVTLLVVYAVWNRRCESDRRTSASLLVCALALVTAAIPIHLQFYGLPIAWALEAVLFAYVGMQFERKIMQLFAFGAIFLAATALLANLPLHTVEFVPFFNRPFGSWAIVAVACFIISKLQQNCDAFNTEPWKRLSVTSLLIGIFLLCTLLHNEVSSFWNVRMDTIGVQTASLYNDASLIVLWALIGLTFVEISRRTGASICIPLACVAWCIGLILIFASFGRQWPDHMFPFIDYPFLSRLLFTASLGYGAYQYHKMPFPRSHADLQIPICSVLETVAHGLFIVSLSYEIYSWTHSFETISSQHKHGILSTCWSLYALGLIVFGLKTRVQMRRIIGFILFGVTIVKILQIDMSLVQPVYRILSFGACGILLIVAAFIYQRYAKLLLGEDDADGKEVES
ncbi:MAG: DUF2339 domain-containing protein [Candidatus Omnitrophota bacterium]|jgi:uncharacterized membrane protein|nr:MAG: DUF2339 domain-containing protein [Candidatus Omnitrophota bacterium]